MTGRIDEGIEHVLALLVTMVTTQSLGDVPIDCLSMDEAFGVDVDLLSCKLLSDRVQGLGDLAQIRDTLELLALHFICGLFDDIDARLHASELVIVLDLRQKLVQIGHEGC